MTGPYALVGARLVERGYAALPILPGSKRPGHLRGGEWVGMHDWQSRYASRLPTRFEIEHWSSTEAGVGVVTGPASHDLVAIDIDSDDAEVRQAIMDCLPYTPARKKGAKGETLFFRGPGVASRSYNHYDARGTRLGRLLDIIGPGRQTVLPPTVHPDTGQPYVWTGENALDAVDPAELPVIEAEIGEALATALRPYGYLPEPSHPKIVPAPLGDDGDKPHRALNTAALSRLDAWVPRLGLYKLQRYQSGYRAVATWRPSHTGRALEKRSPNLKIVPGGIRDFHDGERSYTPLDLVRAACDCDLDTAFASLAHWIGWAPAEPIVLAEPVRITVGDVVADAETGEILEELPATQIAPPDVPGGVIGEIAAWILSVARRPQPRFAVAAALSLVGTVASRQMMTPSFAPLNLYMLTIARSGHGKDAPPKCIISALSRAGLGDVIGPDGLQSQVALYDQINRHPVSILPIDEFGDFIAATSGPRAPPHVMQVIAALRKAWSASIMATPHAASRKFEVLHYPCMSLFCASTPEQFYNSIGHHEAVNGTLNRFLIVHVTERPPRGEGGQIERVPPSIVEALKAIADRPGGINAGRFRAGQAQHPLDEQPYTVPWADDVARARWRAYEDDIGARSDANPKLSTFAERCPENALRIATILAVSENIADPRVSVAHLEWAIAFVEQSLHDMMTGYDSHVPMSESAILAGRVIDFLKSKGGSATRREVFRALQRRFKRAQDIDDLMKVLSEGGEVETIRTVPSIGGHPVVSYKITP